MLTSWERDLWHCSCPFSFPSILICINLAGLEEFNSDKSKCKHQFDVYKECKKKEVRYPLVSFVVRLISLITPTSMCYNKNLKLFSIVKWGPQTNFLFFGCCYIGDSNLCTPLNLVPNPLNLRSSEFGPALICL